MREGKLEKCSSFREKAGRAGRKAGALLLALLLAVSALSAGNVPEVQAAAIGTTGLDDAADYAIVTSDGRLVRATADAWNTPLTVKNIYDASENKVESGEVFRFSAGTLDGKVKISAMGLNSEGKCLLRSENGGAADYVFADTRNVDESHNFTINITNQGDKGTIQDQYGKYLYVGGDDNRLLRTDDASQAEIFTFVKDVSILDTTVWIENVKTGKVITFADQPEEDFSTIYVTGDKSNLTDYEKFTPEFLSNNTGVCSDVVAFKSVGKEGFLIASDWYQHSADDTYIGSYKHSPGGWESIGVFPAGNGTVVFRDSKNGHLITVNEETDVLEAIIPDPEDTEYSEEITDRERFIIHTDVKPGTVKNLAVDEVNQLSVPVPLTWDKITDSIISGYEVWRKGAGEDDANYSKVAEVTENSYTDDTALPSTQYTYKVRAVNGQGSAEDETIILNGDFSDTVNASTKAGDPPYSPTNLKIEEQNDNQVKITWEDTENMEAGKKVSYEVYAALSAYGEYVKISGDDPISEKEFEYAYTTGADGTKYQYYKVAAVDMDIHTKSNYESEDVFVSLEKELFGENVFIFAPTDDIAKINQIVQNIFKLQNDASATPEAQYNENRYAIYYKPGDYTAADCVPVGFYTHIGGLGKIPNDVKLNNIEVPAYLDGKDSAANSGFAYWQPEYGYPPEADGVWRNATCNFWRFAENLAVIKGTGATTTVPDSTPLATNSSNWKADMLNWSVAQAAPLRRVYSERAVSYDWSYGWASAGCFKRWSFIGEEQWLFKLVASGVGNTEGWTAYRYIQSAGHD